MNDMNIGDQVLDADGRPWTVLNAPCRIPGAESEGLFREERPMDASIWNGGRQMYGQHMRHPLVVLEGCRCRFTAEGWVNALCPRHRGDDAR